MQQSPAQEIGGSNAPNIKLEVANYLAQSQKALACDPTAARDLAKKALDRVSAARETDPVLIDALGQLKSESNIAIRDAEKRRSELEASEKDSRLAIKEARLQTASDLLKKTDPDGCYAGSRSLDKEIASHNAKAEKLVAKGNRAVVGKRPKRAIKLYERAGKINSEYPELPAKMASARDAAIRRGPVLGKGVAIVLLIGVAAIVYAAVWSAHHNPND